MRLDLFGIIKRKTIGEILMKLATLLMFAVLLLVVGSRLEIALQQAAITPPICIVERPVYIDSELQVKK